MLIRELIARHIGPEGALHTIGIQIHEAEVPPGVTTHHDGGHSFEPAAGDLLLVSAPVCLGLEEHIDTDLPVGVKVVLLFEVEVADLPVERVLATLAVARLQVVEATVVSDPPTAEVASDPPTATVGVVAMRSDEPVVPQPSLAQRMEPGDHTGPAVLQRLLGEITLKGLVQPARERALRVQVGELEARIGEVTTKLEQIRVDRRNKETALVLSRDTARKEANAARKEADAERKRMQSLRSSTSFKLASRLARASGAARRVIRRQGPGKSPG